MKVANVIIAHKNPSQLLRLVNHFDGNLFHHFIHIDGRCEVSEFQALVDHPHVTILPKRRKLVWAGYGFTQVTIEAFEIIRATSQSYFYINLMSGQDYPIKPTHQFYQFLKDSYGKEFFEIATMQQWPEAYHRYERFHLADWTIRGRYRLEDLINLFIPKRKFYGGLVPYGKSAWFTITDKFLIYFLDYLKEHPDMIGWMKTIWSADEFIGNTLVMNSPFQKNVYPGNLRYIDWSEKKVNPKLLRIDDFESIIASDCFLARKFDDQVDSEILAKIDLHIQQTS